MTSRLWFIIYCFLLTNARLKLQLEYSNAASMKKWGWNNYTIFEITDDSLPERRYKSLNLIDNNGRVSSVITQGNYCDDILTTRILNFIDNNKKSHSLFITRCWS